MENKLTWNDLCKQILAMTSEQKQTDVTVKVDDEFYAASLLLFTSNDDDALDPDHPFLVISQ